MQEHELNTVHGAFVLQKTPTSYNVMIYLKVEFGMCLQLLLVMKFAADGTSSYLPRLRWADSFFANLIKGHARISKLHACYEPPLTSAVLYVFCT